MKFIHTADTHLGVTLSHASFKNATQHTRRVQELRDAFFRLMDTADEQGINMLFIAGDMFESSHIKFFEMQAIFKKLGRLNCEVFLVIGNHDTFLHEKAYLSLINESGVHTFTKDQPVHRFENIDIYGINTRDFSQTHLNTLNDTLDVSKDNVLLLHGDVYNALDDNYLASVKTLESTGFDYIGLGHIHKHAFLNNYIAYSGNLEPLDFSETAPRGFIEGRLEDGQLHAEFKVFQSRAFTIHEISVDEHDVRDSVLSKVRKSVRDKKSAKNFNRFIFTGEKHKELTLDFAWLGDTLEEDVYYVEFKDETEDSISLEALKTMHEDDAVGKLITNYDGETENDEEDKEALDAALRALLATRRKAS
jgi:DNA repair exonuclease SbcCD nuclease subunit